MTVFVLLWFARCFWLPCVPSISVRYSLAPPADPDGRTNRGGRRRLRGALGTGVVHLNRPSEPPDDRQKIQLIRPVGDLIESKQLYDRNVHVVLITVSKRARVQQQVTWILGPFAYERLSFSFFVVGLNRSVE